MIDREGAYAALAARLADGLASVPLDGMPNSDGWFVTRQYRDFDDSRLPQPACCVVARSQGPTSLGAGNVHAWALAADAIVYFRIRDSDAVVDTTINQVIDAIDGALNLTPAEAGGDASLHTTLGGKAVRASIEGEIRMFQGLPEGQTVVVIPITMLVA